MIKNNNDNNNNNSNNYNNNNKIKFKLIYVLNQQPEGQMKKINKYILKGKAVPLQAWSGPDGSRKLRFPDFMTKAQDSGEVVSLTHRPPLPQGNTPATHIC